jgi:hypothetical protein
VRPTSIPVIYFLPFLRGGGGGILSDVSQVQAVRALFRFLLLSFQPLNVQQYHTQLEISIY